MRLLLASLLAFLLVSVLALPPARAWHERPWLVGDRDVDGYHSHYHLNDHGRIHEWSKPGLGKVSLCMEVDRATHGIYHRIVVPDGHCEMPETVFEWSAPEGELHSACVRVDRETGGQRYRRPADDKNCAKPGELEARWIQTSRGPACAEVDRETMGKKYRALAPKRRCPGKLDPYAFSDKEPLFMPEEGRDSGGRAPASLPNPDAEGPIFLPVPGRLYH